MSDEQRGLRVEVAEVGQGEYAGICFTAAALVIEAETVEEGIAKARAFAEEVQELTEAHPGVRLARGPRETVIALEITLGIARASSERTAAERARRN